MGITVDALLFFLFFVVSWLCIDVRFHLFIPLCSSTVWRM